MCRLSRISFVSTGQRRLETSHALCWRATNCAGLAVLEGWWFWRAGACPVGWRPFSSRQLQFCLLELEPRSEGFQFKLTPRRMLHVHRTPVEASKAAWASAAPPPLPSWEPIQPPPPPAPQQFDGSSITQTSGLRGGIQTAVCPRITHSFLWGGGVSLLFSVVRVAASRRAPALPCQPAGPHASPLIRSPSRCLIKLSWPSSFDGIPSSPSCEGFLFFLFPGTHSKTHHEYL